MILTSLMEFHRLQFSFKTSFLTNIIVALPLSFSRLFNFPQRKIDKMFVETIYVCRSNIISDITHPSYYQ